MKQAGGSIEDAVAEKERLRQLSGDTNGDATHEHLLQHSGDGDAHNATVTSPV